MDQLGHVNDVTYVDYLQEARVDMLRVHPPTQGGEALAEGVVVVRHEVKYVNPLVFRPEPVSIDIWATEVRASTVTLAYEVYDEGNDGRRVYIQARSVLTPYVFDGEHPRRVSPGEKAVLQQFLQPGVEPLRAAVPIGEPAAGHRHVYDCAVRFSDVDAYRHVNNVKYFEYYQEARISHLVERADARLGAGDADTGIVVAQIDVDYRRPLFFREQPYAVDTWVGDIGRSSFVMEGRIRDGDDVVSRCRAVVVAFDKHTGRSKTLSDEQRAALSRPL
jgi:acyl-CoA thioester hydrolase